MKKVALFLLAVPMGAGVAGCASTHERDLEYYSTQMAPGCRLVSEQCTQRSKFPRVIDIHRYELSPTIKLNMHHSDMTVEYGYMKVTRDSTPEEIVESLVNTIDKFNTGEGTSFSVLEKRPILIDSLPGYLAVVNLEYSGKPGVHDKRAYAFLKAPDAVFIFRYMPSPLYFDNIRDIYECEFPCFMSVINNFSLKR